MSRPELRLESVQATGQVTVGRRGRGLRTAGGVCPAAGSGWWEGLWFEEGVSVRGESGVALGQTEAQSGHFAGRQEDHVWGGKQEFRFGQRCAEVACGPAVLETDPGELPARGGPQAREGTQDGRRPGGPRPDWGSGGRSRCQPSACARRRCTHVHTRTRGERVLSLHLSLEYFLALFFLEGLSLLPLSPS